MKIQDRLVNTMTAQKISVAVIRRLPRYYRYLNILIEEGTDRISSAELSQRMNVTASQIRQDLNHFGGFGQQGYGYNVKYLHSEIGKVLGLDKGRSMAIIGIGNFGKALARNKDFASNDFYVVNQKFISLYDVKIRHSAFFAGSGPSITGMKL